MRVFLLSLLLALAACTTPAPPKPAMVPLGTTGDFGYSSKELGPDRIEVTYRGAPVAVSVSDPRDDSRARAEVDKTHDLALWRVAQIASERGKGGFKIENENRDSDIVVQNRTYHRPNPFYDPFFTPYNDPFWPRYRRPYYPYYDDDLDWPYRIERVRSATARAKITLVVTLYQSFDPKVAGMQSTAETLSKLKAARSGAVY